MKRIFTILFLLYFINAHGASSYFDEDTSTYRVGYFYYDIGGSNGIFSFNTELNLVNVKNKKYWPSIRLSAVAISLPVFYLYYNTSGLSVRINNKLSDKVLLHLETGVSFVNLFYKEDDNSSLFPDKDTLRNIYFLGIGSKFFVGKKFIISPAVYLLTNVNTSTGMTLWGGISLGGTINEKKEHYKDEFYDKVIRDKNILSVSIISLLNLSISYYRIIYSNRIISYFVSGSLCIVPYKEIMNYFNSIPFFGVGFEVNPYKRWFIRYAVNKDLVDGLWSTFNIGYRISRRVGISFKKNHPLINLDLMNSSFELGFNSVTIIPLINVDIFF